MIIKKANQKNKRCSQPYEFIRISPDFLFPCNQWKPKQSRFLFIDECVNNAAVILAISRLINLTIALTREEEQTSNKSLSMVEKMRTF